MRRLSRIHQLLLLWGQYQTTGVVVADGCLKRVVEDDFSLNPVEFNAVQLQKIKSIDLVVQQLEIEYQRYLVAVYVLNKTLGEVARVLGMTRANLHHNLCRLDRKINQMLMEQENGRVENETRF